jgi:hypothetical protein
MGIREPISFANTVLDLDWSQLKGGARMTLPLAADFSRVTDYVLEWGNRLDGF